MMETMEIPLTPDIDSNDPDHPSFVAPPRWSRSHTLTIGLLIAGVALVAVVATATVMSINKTPPAAEEQVQFMDNVYHQDGQVKSSSRDQERQQSEFTFEDMYNSSYNPTSVSASWVGTTNYLLYLNSNVDLLMIDPTTSQSEVVMDGSIYEELGWQQYSMAPDQRFILLRYDYVNPVQDTGYYESRYKIFDREAQIPEEELIDFPNDEIMKDEKIQYAYWTSAHDNTLLFIRKDDLYMQDSPFSAPVRLTTTGTANVIRNGMSFWNYNGVLWDTTATWFSSDGQYLAYGSFDSSTVPLTEFPIYGDHNQVYADMFRQTYLKSGDAENFSYGRLLIRDMNNPQDPDVELLPPEEFQGQHNYFWKVAWQTPTHLMVGWCDRRQKHSIIQICDVTTLQCITNLEEFVEDGWLEGYQFLWFIDDYTSYLSILSDTIEDGRTFKQVAVVSAPLDGPGEVTFLTNSDNMVWYILGFDTVSRKVFYYGTDGNALKRHLFSVDLPDPGGELQPPTCLSCDIAEDCQYVTASFSWSTDYFFLSCYGPGIPIQYLISSRDQTVITLEDNAELRDVLATKLMPTREYHYIDLGDGYQGWAEFVLPPGMVTNGSVTYPVILYPYAGPHGHTQATYAYNGMWPTGGGWETFLASSHNIITVRIDGRGAGGREDEFMFAVYRRLGTYEVTDQIDGARYIRDTFPFVDRNRIAIWGWSYGGFTTAHAIGDNSDVITCGLAVAPVTNFRWYYAGYTEKYMDIDTEDDNSAGYNGTDVTRKVENFRGKKFFLAHGTLDDNVHFQHSAELITYLQKAQIPFKQEIFVDQNHGINDPLLDRYLFQTMTQYLLETCSFGQ